MTDTFSLKLLYGIPPAVGDPLSAEQGMEVIALASEVMRPAGFFMDEERPFFPQIAGLKNGGAWLDNPAEDGRHLQSEAKGNIVETIYVKLAGDVTQRYHYLSALSRFADEARRFHSTDYQTRPVQIEWWATGAPGAQWALVYNIDYAVQRAHSDAGTVFDVVITVEREPAWRGVMFGLPATVWTQYALGNDPGSDYTYADLSLVDGTALYQETVQNKHEFDGANGYTANFPPLSKNYIDIDASDIPGDAPALVSIAANFHEIHRSGATASEWTMGRFIIARSTKPRTWQPRQGGEDRPQFYSLAAGDAKRTNGTLTTPGSSIDAQALFSNGSSVTKYYYQQSAAIAIHKLAWGEPGGAQFAKYGISMESFRGRFAAFVRGRTDVTSPATFQLKLARTGQITTSSEINLTPPYIPVGTTNEEGFTMYIGNFTLPVNARARISPEGYGPEVQDMDVTNSDFRTLVLDVTTATASVTTFIYDLVLMPFDENQIKLVFTRNASATALANSGDVIYDNTGYLARSPDPIGRILNVNYDVFDPELLGNQITLSPKTDNRLYFLFDRLFGATTNYAALEKDLDVRVNIIPRWYGIRDK